MNFSKFLTKVSPQPPLGGLEISDSIIRLVLLAKGKPVQFAFRLPPGVVEGGRLKDKSKLEKVLKELFRQLPANRRKNLGLILTIPSNNVFIQTINLPPVAAQSLEATADLNLQMVSPLRAGQSYSDWQRIDRGEASRGSIELLGAFAAREIIDDFVNSLKEIEFNVVAVEFISLSLVRDLRQKQLTHAGKPYLVIEVRAEGATFMLVRNNQLLFHSFHDWSTIQGEGRTVPLADFLAVLTQEVNNISNFYLAHWGGLVNNLVFITSGLENEIKQALKDKSITFLNPQEVTAASGAASRPLLEEKEISLLGTSSTEIIRQNRVLAFVALWRTVLAAIFGFLLLLSLGSDLFLRQLAKETEKMNALSLNEPGHKELVELREKASKFNQLVALVRGQRQEESPIGAVADLANNLAGVAVRIDRFYIPSLDAPITISGVASDDEAAIDFKNRLAEEKTLTQVDLPLSGITPQTGGQVAFTIHFKVVPQSAE